MLQIVGHRGAKGLAPENTLASLQQALEYGVNEIEIDVRVTQDGIPILVHDKSLKRLTGKHIKIADYPFKTLKRHKADLTTLEEAIHFVDRRVPLLIEIKPGEPITPIVEILEQFLHKGWHSKDFLLGSFSQRTLLALHTCLPDIPKVVIQRFSTLRALQRARQLQTKRLSLNRYFVWQWQLRILHKKGYSLYAYATKKPTRALRLARHGLVGVITDFPDRHQ